MGITYIEGSVTSPAGKRATAKFLIDSGAKYTVLPAEIWRAIGLTPKRRLTFVLADGTQIERDVSEAHIALPQGESHTPVVLGAEEDQALLGGVTLEELGLVFNPFERFSTTRSDVDGLINMATLEQLVPISPKPSQNWDVERIRKDFPVLRQTVNGKPLVYLDNAASSQVPLMVIERGAQYIEQEHSNIHRGVHYLSMKATTAYEGAREKVRRFINAREVKECIFVRGATEGINLVMHGYGRKFIGAGDEIIISAMEHHANIVPWQMLGEEKGAKLRVIPMNDAGELLMDEYDALLNERTRFVAVTHVSNALGTVNPVKEIIERAHKYGVPVLIDGAQQAPHGRIDVQDLDCDFYAFSGHKMFAPTGSGVVYGKAALLETMNPFQGGGDMIKSVTFEKTTYADLPNKFEAGTPAIASQIGLGAAIDYLNMIGRDKAAAYEHELLRYATERVSAIEGVRIIGTAREKLSVVSFVIDDIHPHDIGTILDQQGIAVRAGHHCAQPVMQRFNVPATARASFAFYNTKEEVDVLAEAIEKVIEVFS